jgi:hypothetical protein
MSSAMSGLEDEYGRRSGMMANWGAGAMAFIYVLIALLWFFPLLSLFRFSAKMKTALAGNDQQALNISFQNLKACLRYVGIVTIIILALYALAIVMGILGMAAFS